MAKTLNAARTYDHKKFGRIGVAELLVKSESDIIVMLNGKELPASSIDHLLTFALQSLQDAYAGAESEADAKERFNAKLERILNGTLGVRSGGAGVDPVMVEIRSIIRGDVKAAIGAETWKAMEEDARNEAIDGVFAQQDEATQRALIDAAKAEIARKAAERAAKAELGKKLVIKM